MILKKLVIHQNMKILDQNKILRKYEETIQKLGHALMASRTVFLLIELPGETLGGCATNMGSKISLLVYEWPLIKCKIWYMNGSIFQRFPKFEPELAQI